MIKCIPTKYDGVEFRSRLEARWAVFFNELGIKWYYEYEGFDLDGEWYLPDFYLPEVKDGMFFEVKPLVEDFDLKIAKLCCKLKSHTGLLLGPPEGWCPDRIRADWEVGNLLFDHESGCEDYSYDFCICAKTGKPGFVYEGQRR